MCSLSSIWAMDRYRDYTTISHGPFNHTGDLLLQDPIVTAGVCAAGIACFHVLGGKYYSLLASDYTGMGAFRHSRARRLAGLDYADSKNRGAMDLAGRLVGCHTCGTRRAEAYIADHQPPLKFVKREDQAWLRKYVLGPTRQDFYPQCKECSTKQAQVVKTEPARRPLNYHWTSLRAYHATGWILGLGWIGYQQGWGG